MRVLCVGMCRYRTLEAQARVGAAGLRFPGCSWAQLPLGNSKELPLESLARVPGKALTFHTCCGSCAVSNWCSRLVYTWVTLLVLFSGVPRYIDLGGN